jgi:riboflavin kinase/FMN adenylyltransferase
MTSIYRSVHEIPASFGPSVAAIGNFDGVHLGHQEILSAVVAEARALGAQAVAITFDPHPDRFLRPAEAPELLTPMNERLRLLGFTGIDAVLLLPFDAALASMPAREFVRSILAEKLRLRGLHEGGNFRFGRRAEAGVAELKEFGAEFGFALHVHAPVHVHGLEVSSSAIRERVAAGDMCSTQVRGRGIGTRLVVPTVNLANYDGQLPAFGVYFTRLKVGGRRFQAVTNVGNRPTFGEASFAIESYILDFEPVEMDEQTPVQLEFLLRLRGERKWPSPEALKAQIGRDVAKAKRYFRLAR